MLRNIASHMTVIVVNFNENLSIQRETQLIANNNDYFDALFNMSNFGDNKE